MDIFFPLDCMKGNSNSVLQSMLTTADKQLRLMIQTGAEALALGALRQLVLSTLLHSTTMGENERYGVTNHQTFLSRLNTQKDWSNSSHGMKVWMTN
jgi:hypothetical protein